MVIRLVIPTIRLDPPRSDQIESASILACENPSRSDVSDCYIPPRNRKVEGFGSRGLDVELPLAAYHLGGEDLKAVQPKQPGG
jgi:hypothetical protein